jgi:hypothetical protein
MLTPYEIIEIIHCQGLLVIAVLVRICIAGKCSSSKAIQHFKISNSCEVHARKTLQRQGAIRDENVELLKGRA